MRKLWIYLAAGVVLLAALAAGTATWLAQRADTRAQQALLKSGQSAAPADLEKSGVAATNRAKPKRTIASFSGGRYAIGMSSNAGALAFQPPLPPDSGRATNSASSNRMGRRMRDPRALARMQEGTASRISERYAALFQYLQLDGATQEKLVKMMADRASQQFQGLAALQDGSLSAEDRQRLMKANLERQQAFYDNVYSLLGEDRFDSFVQYEQTSSERQQTERFRQMVAGQGYALSAEQQNLLVQRMFAARVNLAPQLTQLMAIRETGVLPSRAVTIDQLRAEMAATHDQVMRDAAEIMSPEQQVLLDNFLRERETRQERRLQRMLNMRGGGAPPRSGFGR